MLSTPENKSVGRETPKTAFQLVRRCKNYCLTAENECTELLTYLATTFIVEHWHDVCKRGHGLLAGKRAILYVRATVNDIACAFDRTVRDRKAASDRAASNTTHGAAAHEPSNVQWSWLASEDAVMKLAPRVTQLEQVWKEPPAEYHDPGKQICLVLATYECRYTPGVATFFTMWTERRPFVTGQPVTKADLVACRSDATTWRLKITGIIEGYLDDEGPACCVGTHTLTLNLNDDMGTLLTFMQGAEALFGKRKAAQSKRAAAASGKSSTASSSRNTMLAVEAIQKTVRRYTNDGEHRKFLTCCMCSEGIHGTSVPRCRRCRMAFFCDKKCRRQHEKICKASEFDK